MVASGLIDAPWPPVYPKMPNEETHANFHFARVVTEEEVTNGIADAGPAPGTKPLPTGGEKGSGRRRR